MSSTISAPTGAGVAEYPWERPLGAHPRDDSLVEFRYVPMSLYLGAAVSLLSGLALGAALIVSIRRRR